MIFLIALCLSSTFNAGAEDKPVKKDVVKVLIVGLNDNVRSNYYYDASIAEETGIHADSIVTEFNRIIARNIEEALPESSCKFISAGHAAADETLLSQIECTGEAEQAHSNLNAIPAEKYKEILNQAQANYLLVLNQHYLKRQDQPMRTVFHMMSYTLYDQDRKEVLNGNQYFTSMKLETAEKIKSMSRKSTAKIASSIAKVLER